MGDPALVAIDAARIQSFLTTGGRLRDLAGGSALVERIGDTEEGGLLNEALSKCGLTPIDADNGVGGEPGEGEFLLLRNSGGAVQGIAPSKDKAKELVSELSLGVLGTLPGLTLLSAVEEISKWEKSGFEEAWRATREFVSAQKQSARGGGQFAPPFLARCEASGEPATGYDNKDMRLADNPRVLRGEADDANDRLKQTFKTEAGDQAFPLDVDYLSADDGGYLGVIHLDGNDIGRLLRKSDTSATDLNGLLTKRRKVSTDLAKLSEAPTSAVIEHFCGLIKEKVMEAPDGRWRLALKDDKLPLRPLVMGGDDLTIVCEGRIAFPLAIRLLKEFEDCSRDVAGELGADGQVVHACAGVAVVKKHYPFAKAYELAEQLTGLAKKSARKERGSYIDFEVVTATQHTAPDVARGTAGVGHPKANPELRLTGKPYSIDGFNSLLDDAWTVHTRLPSGKVRAIADAAMESKDAADSALKHLLSQLGRGLTGLNDPLRADELRALVHQNSIFDDNSTRWHDLIEISRFFTSFDADEVNQQPATAGTGEQQ